MHPLFSAGTLPETQALLPLTRTFGEEGGGDLVKEGSNFSLFQTGFGIG